MKVLFHLLDAGTGGGQLVATRVAGKLAQRGDEIGVAVPTPGPAVETFAALGAKVILVDASTLRRPRSAEALGRILGGYDLLYSHTEIPGVILGAAAATTARRPHVVHEHNYPYFSPTPTVRAAQRVLLRRVAGRARFIAVAEHVAAGLRATGIRPDRVAVVPNGVPPVEAPGAAGPPGGGVVTVGMLARLDPRKNVDVFLAAAALAAPAAPVRFVVGGASGPFEEYERAVREQAERTGIEIVDTVRGAEFLRDLDIVVIPSSYEGSPLVLYEAMAAGRAIVATDIPGIREALEPEHAGVLVPPGDVAALAGAIEELAGDAARRGELGNKAREVASKRYDLGTMLERTVAILDASLRT